MFALMALVGCGGDDDTSQDPIVGADAAPAVDAGTEAPPPPVVDAAPGSVDGVELRLATQAQFRTES